MIAAGSVLGLLPLLHSAFPILCICTDTVTSSLPDQPLPRPLACSSISLKSTAFFSVRDRDSRFTLSAWQTFSILRSGNPVPERSQKVPGRGPLQVHICLWSTLPSGVDCLTELFSPRPNA